MSYIYLYRTNSPRPSHYCYIQTRPSMTQVVQERANAGDKFLITFAISILILLVCGLLFSFLKYLYDEHKKKSYLRVSKYPKLDTGYSSIENTTNKKRKGVFNMDIAVYILLGIVEVAVGAFSFVTKSNVWYTFIPLGIGVVYSLIMKITGAIMMVKVCKNTNANTDSIKQLAELIKK